MHERIALNFAKLALRHFAFLEDNDFVVQEKGIYRVVYCKDEFRVGIYHEKLSYEVYTAIFWRNRSVDLNEVLTYFNLIEKSRTYQAVSEESLDFVLAEIAVLFSQFCLPLLVEGKIKEVLDFVAKQQINNQLEAEMLRIKGLADKAWKERDYKSVIQLYDRYIENLTSLQARQLSYAKKNLRLKDVKNTDIP